jgi:hypothetical protein
MASASDSNDASDIFWPGYVDAVTNLAINLLFVIAVMSIVVLTSVLQMAKLKPEEYVPKTTEVTQGKDSSTNASTQSPDSQPAMVQSAQQVQQALDKVKAAMAQSASAVIDKSSESAKHDGATEQALKALLSALDQNSKELAPGKLEKMLADKAAAEKLSSEQEQALKKLQKELQALKTGQAQQRGPQGSADDTGGTGDTSGRADVVNATQNKQAPKSGPSEFQTLNAGGLVVVFGKDVVELSDKEVSELIQKMSQISPLSEGQWLIQVISPKGFSEATRLAYYRVNNIRNAMLKNGVQASAIEMRVVESESTGANNARVLVRPVKP